MFIDEAYADYLNNHKSNFILHDFEDELYIFLCWWAFLIIFIFGFIDFLIEKKKKRN